MVPDLMVTWCCSSITVVHLLFKIECYLFSYLVKLWQILRYLPLQNVRGAKEALDWLGESCAGPRPNYLYTNSAYKVKKKYPFCGTLNKGY